MTPVIEIKDLAKSYRVYQKREGLLGSVRGLFRREFREVHAVRGIDLRTVGSGNLGATNVYRELGAVPAIVVLLLDVDRKSTRLNSSH